MNAAPKIERRPMDMVIYQNTIMDKSKLYLSRGSKEKTPHVFAPKTDDVFVDFDESLKEKIVPLFQLDLSALNPANKEKVYFLYYESGNVDWIIYQLDENSKITAISAMDNYIQKKIRLESKATEEFESGLDDLLENMTYTNQKAGPYIEIIPYDMPQGFESEVEKEKDDKAKYKKYSEIRQQTKIKYRDPEKRAFEFGPYPMIVQSNFAVPYINDTAFQFVGEIYSSEEIFGGLTDFTFYLFYHPEKKVVAQLRQYT
jgi:hypothetical protein